MAITGSQARAARAILKWTVAEASKQAEIAPNTIVRVEADKSVNTATLGALQRTYESKGVRFGGEGCVCPPTQDNNVLAP